VIGSIKRGEDMGNSMIVGLALDVSGSMSASLQNPGGGQLSRLDGIRNAIDEIVVEAQRLTEGTSSEGIEPAVSFFALAFGMQIPGHKVCDLFRVLEVQQDRSRYSGQGAILQALRDERTLTLQELRQKWSSFRDGIRGTNEYMGGGTPMREAFELANSRFRGAILGVPGPKLMLFVVSDGQSGDGDPGGAATEMKKMGVTIISCFVASSDVAPPRELVNVAPADLGAQTMFDVASTVIDGSPEEQYLRECGWKFPVDSGQRAPKLFSQINHTEVLNEFIQLVLTPLRAEKTDPKKAGPH